MVRLNDHLDMTIAVDCDQANLKTMFVCCLPRMFRLGHYNSSFVYCRVKRSHIPLETSKSVHTIYSITRSFALLFL